MSWEFIAVLLALAFFVLGLFAVVTGAAIKIKWKSKRIKFFVSIDDKSEKR